ncbi:MAG: D-aminoacyl-tRNA deacylase [Candidatus Micrarchaeota archaeon]
MIILFTKKNLASANIARALIDGHGFDGQGEGVWRNGDLLLKETDAPTVLEVPTDFDTDCLLVLSTHRSKNPGRALTAHVPGNWGDAQMGGEPRTLNTAPASRLKILIQELKKEADAIGWTASLEADHHGPTCQVPIMFVEIGNGEAEWTDGKAAEAVAEAVMASAKRNERFDTVFGVGGGHYPRHFSKLAIESETAVGHMAPKYVIDSLDEEMFSQAIRKNVEKVSRVLVVKDETSAPHREKIKDLAGRFAIEVEIA